MLAARRPAGQNVIDVKSGKNAIASGRRPARISSLDYPTRLLTLLRHRLGLWDVVTQAQRKGGLDSRIRNHASNDLVALFESLPHLIAVTFNGGTAAQKRALC